MGSPARSTSRSLGLRSNPNAAAVLDEEGHLLMRAPKSRPSLGRPFAALSRRASSRHADPELLHPRPFEMRSGVASLSNQGAATPRVVGPSRCLLRATAPPTRVAGVTFHGLGDRPGAPPPTSLDPLHVPRGTPTMCSCPSAPEHIAQWRSWAHHVAVNALRNEVRSALRGARIQREVNHPPSIVERAR